MLFNFVLQQLDLVQTWGERPGPEKLHWFGLTDGQFWIQAGDTLLFEYDEQVRSTHGWEQHCDYFIVRLHEDLLEILPAVLEPIPADLIPYISCNSAARWYDTFSSWSQSQPDECTDDDQYQRISGLALEWAGSRTLSTHYLTVSPEIVFWSDPDSVHLEWDFTKNVRDGRPVWTAGRGSFQMAREDFIHEVRSFHTRLMEQMSERVAQVAGGALPSRIQIDLEELQREHAKRCQSLDKQLKALATPTDWTSVHQAILQIESEAQNRST